MINDWFVFQHFEIKETEDTAVIFLHDVYTLRRIGKMKAGTEFEWVSIDLFGGGVVMRQHKNKIVDHQLAARMGVERDAQESLYNWLQRTRFWAP